MADFFTFEADEIETVNGFVDFLAVEHSAAQFVDADAEKLLVVLFYLAPTGFVTWKIFIFRVVVRAVIDVIGGSILGRPSRGFFLGSRHFAFLLPSEVRFKRRASQSCSLIS